MNRDNPTVYEMDEKLLIIARRATDEEVGDFRVGQDQVALVIDRQHFEDVGLVEES